MTQAKKSIYFLFLWLMCCIIANVYGQYETATNGSFNTIRTQIPVSPEMALYQKYGDIPVDYSTGVANILIRSSTFLLPMYVIYEKKAKLSNSANWLSMQTTFLNLAII